MLQLRFVLSLFASLSIFAGCAKKAPDGGSATSSVAFTLPAGFGNGSFANSACFAVNILGKGIKDQNPGECDGRYGVFGGLVPLGGTIELEAPFGKDRTIEIYYVISDNGCKGFDPELGLGATYGTNKVFRISKVPNVDFNKPQVTVKAPIEYPKNNNSIGSVFGLPAASCAKGDDPVNLMHLKQARLVQGAVHGNTDKGSKVSIRVYDQKLDLKSPNNFSGRIQPVRLGEK